jgi:hypothetical protein
VYALSPLARSGGVKIWYQTGYAPPPGSVFDIAAGSNGQCRGSYLCTAQTGYDGPTGVGTPNGVPITLSVSPTTANPGTYVTATWAGIGSPTNTDWVGLYSSSSAANTAYATWRYTTGASNGSMPFPIPDVAPPGTTYELRLFSNNTFTRLATSQSFTVS